MRWWIFFLLFTHQLYCNIYVINQKERPDRWTRIQKLLEEEKVQAVRFCATNGDHFSQKKKKELSRKYKVDLKAKELGRFITQLEIIKEAHKKGFEWIWILEDESKELKPSLIVSRKEMDKILKDPKQLLKITDQGSQKIESAHLCAFETPVVNYLKPIEITHFESGIDLVNCIYVINLDARTDKWDRLKPLFAERNLQVNRVSGINGWQFTKEDKKTLAGPYRPRLKGGQLGCLLSHLSILKDAYKRGFDLIWVLEDDIEFSEDLSHISKLIPKLQVIDPDWDIFYTDSDCVNEKGEYFTPLALDPRPDQTLPPLAFYQERIVIDEDLMQIRSRFATHSMLISKKGIKKILDYFTHVYLFSPIDWDIHYIPNIRQYAARRDIVTKWRNNPYSDTISKSSLNLSKKSK